MTEKKILIIPDSFKDSLSSDKVAHAMEKGLKKKYPGYAYFSYPFADGGEGSLNVLCHALKLDTHFFTAHDSLMRKVKVPVAFSKDGSTAYWEMASVCGLPALKQNERNPMKTTTFGMGEILKKIISSNKPGVKKIVLFVGGSSTCDAGLGMMQALGIKFIDDKKNLIKEPISGGHLIKIRKILRQSAIQSMKSVRFTVCSDVEDILYGKKGAAFIYGPQKGANRKEVVLLDKGLRNISRIFEHEKNSHFHLLPGSGAAGGITYGLMNFFKIDVLNGTEFLIHTCKIENRIREVDAVITGEGRFDTQSLSGKLISVIARKAYLFKKPVHIIAGKAELDVSQAARLGYMNIASIQSLVSKTINAGTAIKNAYKFIIKKAEQIVI